ncbi:hypothetical protein FZEAL_1896 [Fusarium zealandicum]|uniref:Uncharacterized protein n=1 Tax=Fusarium zealandicum TaxID=1053134 RepID=A0A8H4USK8_9HYPO|nr:hypothetical protein FZEAL_1896 [Fusarium zealandicum]
MNNPTDEELDRNWQPSGRRPQSSVSPFFLPIDRLDDATHIANTNLVDSTIARSFSQELMDIFRIDNSLTDLDKEVHDKKQTVDKGAEELASIEARIREMEERLRRSAPGSSRSPLPQAQASKAAEQQLSAPSKDDSKARSRPGTARAAQQAPSSGNMPPTPGASEGEYYVITHADLQDGPR